ncbi:unnamed protein product [Brassica oleracea]
MSEEESESIALSSQGMTSRSLLNSIFATFPSLAFSTFPWLLFCEAVSLSTSSSFSKTLVPSSLATSI